MDWTTIRPLRRQALLQQAVEGGGVQLAEREIGGIGKVDDDEVEMIAAVLQPLQGVGIDHRDPFGDFSAPPLSATSGGALAKQLGHRRVEIDQRHRLDLRILEDLAQRQPVAAAQHQHALRPAGSAASPG